MPLFMKMLVKVIQLLLAQLVVQVTKQLVVVTKLLVMDMTKLSMAHLVEQLQPRKRSAGTARHPAIQLNSKSARVAGG